MSPDDREPTPHGKPYKKSPMVSGPMNARGDSRLVSLVMLCTAASCALRAADSTPSPQPAHPAAAPAVAPGVRRRPITNGEPEGDAGAKRVTVPLAPRRVDVSDAAPATDEVIRGREMVALAKGEVARRDDWTNADVLGPFVLRRAGDWQVLVWYVPHTPGKQRLLTLSDDGRVLEYLPGR